MLQEVATQEAQVLSEQLEHFLPLVEQAIEQTVRRVVHGEKVPAQEKIVSIFEPHTDIIRRGKRIGLPNSGTRSGSTKSKVASSPATGC